MAISDINTYDNWMTIISNGSWGHIPRDSDASRLLSMYNRARRNAPVTPLRREFLRYMTSDRAPGAGPAPIPLGLSLNDFIMEMINDTFVLIPPEALGFGKKKSKKSKKKSVRKSKSKNKSKSKKSKTKKNKKSKRKSRSRKY